MGARPPDIDPSRSQIEDQVVARRRAADECAPTGGALNRLSVVVDVVAYERCLAGMANAGAAGPSNDYVAGFSEFEDAGVLRAPRDGEIGAREDITLAPPAHGSRP